MQEHVDRFTTCEARRTLLQVQQVASGSDTTEDGMLGILSDLAAQSSCDEGQNAAAENSSASLLAID